jgi:hypothetical protein
MFTGTEFWKGCFEERNVYYYDKTCGYQSKPYNSASGTDPCTEEAKDIACNPCDAQFIGMDGSSGSGDIVFTNVTTLSIDPIKHDIT